MVRVHPPQPIMYDKSGAPRSASELYVHKRRRMIVLETKRISLARLKRAGYYDFADGKPCCIPAGTELAFKRLVKSPAVGATKVAFLLEKCMDIFVYSDEPYWCI